MQVATEIDHRKRIDTAIDFILKNLNSDISLAKISELANYSPFHFQKIFKEMMGVSPKQYIIKLRLETALHKMIIHSEKSIQEIAMDSGFSSPAVFSRSVKNMYGISPEKFRLLSMERRTKFIGIDEIKNQATEILLVAENFQVEVKKIEGIRGVYLIAPFDDPDKIKKSFAEILKKASAHDLEINASKIYGVVSPHQANIYKTFLALKENKNIPKKFNSTEIKGGKYACFKVKGSKEETLKAAHLFYNHWLPENGYKIADIVGFETFSENPAENDYLEIEREIYVPIEAI